ncbi:hypothetical protein HWV62_25571 [Athelia sp. TMB]|nr:hypothetical protein HWV62_25571 [Athelia sp. TMB]
MLRSLIGRSNLRTLARLSAPPAKPHHIRHIHSVTPLRTGSIARHSLLLAEGRSKLFNPSVILGVHAFHSTPRREAAPLIPLLLGALKASTALEVARTTARIALTFIPFILIGNFKSRRYLQHAAVHGKPVSDEKKELILKSVRWRTNAFHILLFIPWLLFWATILASLERTPLTGRWRLILLSPDEEDQIANQLAGPGWYQAVGEILAAEGPTRVIPTSDWRYQWVLDTLRKLESTIPILQQESLLAPVWLEKGEDGRPLPPPADYPLRPRPRGADQMRWMWCQHYVAPHAIPGAPYSLVLVDKPDAANAFSYGFGPQGGGGIVVYSGFLDDILAKAPAEPPPAPPPVEASWWSSLFGGLASRPAPTHPIPTPEQTSELAILLAHELAHLVLTHHLETLSSATIIVPGIVSILSDAVRAFLFPITMVFGPFVNDAVAQLGTLGSSEVARLGEYCTSAHQETEADVVSARLLAHAGFDARAAVRFWEARAAVPFAECANVQQAESAGARRLLGSTHPLHDTRIEALKDELVRWELERRVTVARRAKTEEECEVVLSLLAA